MTTLRRIGTLKLIPGIPGKPGTPGYFKTVNLPDPPSQTTLNFGGSGGGVPVKTVFGSDGTVVVNSDGGKTNRGGGGYPPTPGFTEAESFNGEAGKVVVVVQPDGTIKVVKV